MIKVFTFLLVLLTFLTVFSVQEGDLSKEEEELGLSYHEGCDEELDLFRKCMSPLKSKYKNIANQTDYWKDIEQMKLLLQDLTNTTCIGWTDCTNRHYEQQVYRSLISMLRDMYQTSGGCINTIAEYDHPICTEKELRSIKEAARTGSRALDMIEESQHFVAKSLKRNEDETLDLYEDRTTNEEKGELSRKVSGNAQETPSPDSPFSSKLQQEQNNGNENFYSFVNIVLITSAILALIN